MEVKATQKFVIMSPRKLRIVAGLVRELSTAEAFEKLPYVKKRAAGPLRKVIGTAIANAKQKNLNPEDLEFSEIQIGEGPMLKRWRAGARGRAKPYKRRMSHIRVVLRTTKSEIRNSKHETISNDKNSKSKTNKLKGPISLGKLKGNMEGKLDKSRSQKVKKKGK